MRWIVLCLAMISLGAARPARVYRPPAYRIQLPYGYRVPRQPVYYRFYWYITPPDTRYFGWWW